MRIIGCILFLSFLGGSCDKKRNDVPANSSTVYRTDYNLTYLESSGTSTVQVIITGRENPKSPTYEPFFAEGCTLFFNEKAMYFDPAIGVYRLIINSKVQNGEFRFTDQDGFVFTNRIELADSLSVPQIDTAQNGSIFAWKGVPVQPGDLVHMNLSFEPQPSPTHVPISSYPYSADKVGDTSFTIYVGANINLLNEVDIRRVKSQVVLAPTTLGSTMRSTFISRTRNVFIKG